MNNKKPLFFKLATIFNAMGAVKFAFASILVTIFCGAMLYLIADANAPIFVYAIIILLWLGFIGLGIYSVLMQHRIIKKNVQNPPAFTHLHSNLDTTYFQPLDRAAIKEDEHVLASYGPIGRGDIKGLGGTVLFKEKLSGENTIAVTNYQIICFMVGPDDVQDLEKNKVRDAAGAIITNVPGTNGVSVRKEQFQVVYFNQWQTITDSLYKNYPLADMLGRHLNYGIPFDQIRNVSIKKRFINPGLHITLINGTTFKYAGSTKNGLDSIEQALTGKVSIV